MRASLESRRARRSGVPSDCVLGRTISLILPGGYIHRHTDAYMPGQPGHRPGLEHLRCNIVVRLTHPSGRPIVDGSPLPVTEGDLWAFFASKCPHETAVVEGSEPRESLSRSPVVWLTLSHALIPWSHGSIRRSTPALAGIVFGFGWSVAPSHRLQPPPQGWRETDN